ncbi:TPA: HAD family phosphatase, partial [Salmonella enterica]|nr:HAD family phosphatase [Salmonella enterica]
MQIVFSDIDGTFQEMGHPIHEINKEAIRCLQAQGDHFVFVTGRGFELVQDMMAEEGLSCDVIFGNGAGLMVKGEAPVLTHTLPYKTLAQVIGILETEEVFYFLHTDHGIISPQAHLYEAQFQESRKQLLAELGERGQIIADYKYEFFYNECLHKDDVLQFMKEHPEIKVIKIELMEASDEKRERLRAMIQSETAAIFQSFVQTLE